MLRPPIFELSELMNALPRAPAPADSNRPRANTTSTWGPPAAAVPADPGAPGGSTTRATSSAAVVATAARASSADFRLISWRTAHDGSELCCGRAPLDDFADLALNQRSPRRNRQKVPTIQ